MIFIHRDLSDIPSGARSTVMAIGNFDGVHKGHQALIAQAQILAAAQNLSAAVMSFEPHPREFFQASGAPFRLTSLAQKLRLLDRFGIHHFFVPTFDAAFSAQTPGEFIHLLKERLGVRQVVVGADFTFGKGAAGNVDMLRQSMDVCVVETMKDAHGEVYSSTRVRAALQQSDFKTAAAILGRPWEMEAEIIPGDKRGRTIGYPTANQHVPYYVQIPYGVYAVRVKIEDEKDYRHGVANFGIRPMFRVEEPLLETYIFDFDDEIYGKSMAVQPVKHLRAEMYFDDLSALKAQIKQDCHAAKSALSSPSIT